MCAHCQEPGGESAPAPAPVHAAAGVPAPAPPAVIVAAPAQESPIGDVAHATAAAIADGVSTGIALAAGAVEMNPLVPTSPLGLMLITGLKIGVAKFAETLPESEKRLTLKTTSAVWGGAAVNNLLLCFEVPGPIAVLVGLAAAIVTWYRMERAYRRHDLLAAQSARVGAPAPDASVGVPAAAEQGAGEGATQALLVRH
ncbi:hypothetical protein C7C56_027045 [Massilia glaciei]|uniref:Uncharacterized protein n=1 Tax=Massilia glaciei TaxID=1524097 RepID=A0A2U2H9U6_9BURK|nr:hypothetical protein C7C56_027045 [Massilia glaciei]